MTLYSARGGERGGVEGYPVVLVTMLSAIDDAVPFTPNHGEYDNATFLPVLASGRAIDR